MKLGKNTMNETFDSFMCEQLEAMKILYNSRLITSLLMIYYSTLDIVGFVTTKQFQGFVVKYMNDSLLNVNSQDLWNARCDRLHRNTAISKKNKGRMIIHTYGGEVDEMTERIKMSSLDNKCVAADIINLIDSLWEGIEHFKKEVNANDTLKAIFEERVNEFFVEFVRNDI